MKIRLAEKNDFLKIDKIYADAREFMKKSGNEKQWVNGYPKKELIYSDIDKNQLYVVEENGDIVGVFVYFFGEESTYKNIHQGQWINEEKYGVIHRIAVSENAHGKGIGAFCFDYALNQCSNLKIDTHRDNIPMQKVLLKYGFVYCGIIYLDNGAERFAYQIAMSN